MPRTMALFKATTTTLSTCLHLHCNNLVDIIINSCLSDHASLLPGLVLSHLFPCVFLIAAKVILHFSTQTPALTCHPILTQKRSLIFFIIPHLICWTCLLIIAIITCSHLSVLLNTEYLWLELPCVRPQSFAHVSVSL